MVMIFNEDRFYGNLDFSYPITSWINATWRIGTDIANSQLKEWRAITNYTRNDYSDDPGKVKNSTFFSREINSDFILNINRNINPDIEFSSVLGWNVNQRNSENNSISVTGLNIPFFYQISNSSATPAVENEVIRRRIWGLYGNVEFRYKRYLTLTLNARNDWSSTLPTENRSFFYPGVNAAFVFTEAFPSLKDNKFFSFGKVRMGLSQTGNDANPYLIYPIFAQTSIADGYRGLDFPLGGINAFSVGNRIGNSGIKT